MKVKQLVKYFILMLFIQITPVKASEPLADQLENAPSRGEISWNGWVFRYWIENGNEEGLVIGDVEFKGRGVLEKASMPVVRVKYHGGGKRIGSGCGPFADKFYNFSLSGIFTPALSHSTIMPFPGKADATDVVTFERTSIDGSQVLGLYIYAEIGGYKLWHGWNFTDNGQLHPTLYSSGWSCSDGPVKNDHKHHPYWRFEFAVNGSRNDIWEFRTEKDGKTISRKLTTEEDIRRGTDEEIAFVVGSIDSDKHVLIHYPKDVNQDSDDPGRPWYGFARIDAAIRTYKAQEDRGWVFGAKGELGYLETPEEVEGKDNVFWISSHLEHKYVVGVDDENHNHWHWTGPVLELRGWD